MSRLFRKPFLLGMRDEADDLSHITPQRYVRLFWPTTFTVAFGLAALAAWLFTGQLYVTVEARGVIMPLGGVREVASLGRGVVVDAPALGQGRVSAGDVLARISDAAADAEYKDKRRSYQLEAALLATQSRNAERLFDNRSKEIAIRLDGARASLSRLGSIASGFQEATKERDTTETAMLEVQQQAASEVKALYDGMQEGADHLVEKGFASKRDYIQLRQGQTSMLQALSQLAIEKARFTVEKQQLRREFSDIAGDIAAQAAEEQARLGALDEARSQRDKDLETLTLQAAESRSQLLDAERKLWLGSNVLAPYDGELLALKKGLGQPVEQGEALALVSMSSQDRKLLLVMSPRARRGTLTLSLDGHTEKLEFVRSDASFPAEVRAALQKLAPTVAFNTWYSGDGVVVSTSVGQSDVLQRIDLKEADLADAEGVPVFAMLLPIGDDWMARELAMVVLLRPEDAKRVKVGDLALVKPDFEKSLIGARIEARVAQISSYVATTIEAQSLIGSAEVARSLASNLQGQQQGVTAVLRFTRDPSGELVLHGDSLARTLTAGATATTQVRVDRTSPIAVLLPFYVDILK